MKIVHIIPYLTSGGVELYLLNLCKQLKQMKCCSIVLTLQGQVSDGAEFLQPIFNKHLIRVEDLRLKTIIDPMYFPKLISFIRKEKPDILHTHLPRADFAGASVSLALPHIPWVVSVHDIHSQTWSGRWALPFFTWVWQKADAVIAISHAVKEWLIKERKVSKEKISVIHYGIGTDQFRKPNMNLRQAWALDGNVVIGSIGRLEPRKGHETLIRAMPSIIERIPEACLLIAGHDPWNYGEKLKSLIQRMRLGEAVQLVGFQSDIPSFLHALDIFAFASQSEGFGQVLIEAMAAKKPVVASRISPITEIVLENETGLLIKAESSHAFAETIITLAKNPEKARQMGMSGAKRVEKQFSAYQMASKTIQLYLDVFKTNTR